MIAFSINKESLTYEYITDSKVLTVSVLAEGTPIKFIGGFGFRTGRDIGKFEQVRYKIGQYGVPIILDNTASYIEAEVLEVEDVETHILCICKITARETIDDNQVPMTYTYYQDVRGGRTPRSAATYIKMKKQKIRKRS